ncbi:MAG: DUF4279 domain-containing protein [Roseiarcus sp.]
MTGQNPLIEVTIYLRGDALEPEAITRALGINPSRAQKKGDVHTTSTNHKVVRKIGLWAVDSKSKSLELSDHLSEVLGKFDTTLISLGALPSVEEAYIDIFYAYSSEDIMNVDIEFCVTKPQIDTISRLGLKLQTTVGIMRD